MKKTTFLIAGKHAVTEALKNPNRKVLKVFLTEDSKKKLNNDYQKLHLLKNVKIFYKTKKELDRLCSKEQISHQGLIAEIELIDEGSVRDLIRKVQNLRKELDFEVEDRIILNINCSKIFFRALNENIEYFKNETLCQEINYQNSNNIGKYEEITINSDVLYLMIKRV